MALRTVTATVRVPSRVPARPCQRQGAHRVRARRARLPRAPLARAEAASAWSASSIGCGTYGSQRSTTAPRVPQLRVRADLGPAGPATDPHRVHALGRRTSSRPASLSDRSPIGLRARLVRTFGSAALASGPSRRIPRERVDELHVLRHLEPRELLAAMLDELLRSRRRLRAHDDVGNRDSSPSIVGTSDDGSLNDRLVLVKHALDLELAMFSPPDTIMSLSRSTM